MPLPVIQLTPFLVDVVLIFGEMLDVYPVNICM